MPETLIKCYCGGEPYWTIKSDCMHPPCTPGDKLPDAGPSPDMLVPYKLASGTEVVGTYTQFQADNGTLVYRFISPVPPADLGKISDYELVICELKSGLGVIETFADCNFDNGSVSGMFVGKVGGPLKTKTKHS